MKSDFKMLIALIKRNSKIYFKDKLTFFLSLITPLILIVLFIVFLKNVYTSTLTSAMPEDITLSSKVINAFSGGWLFSSIMGVSCITISFCSNMIMATDKINKNILDFNITPVKKYIVNLSYLVSNFISTFVVCFITMIVGFIYLVCVGWFISFVDILLILLTMILNIMFGSLLSTIVCSFINSQGGVSAVSTIVSSMYGFLSGAYMPISQSGKGIQAFVSFIPGTYGTILFRNFYMRGTIKQIAKYVPSEIVKVIEESFDCRFAFFGHNLSLSTMFLILFFSCVVLFLIYVFVVSKNRNNATFKVKHKNAKA